MSTEARGDVPEMVERVARAIDPEAWFVEPPSPFREACRAAARRKARAAIEAMREPTEGMVRAALNEWPCRSSYPDDPAYADFREIHHLMTDEALR